MNQTVAAKEADCLKRMIICVLLLCMLLGIGSAAAQQKGEIIPKYDVMLLPMGKSMLARHTVKPSSLSKGGVTFESSDESIVTVNKQGYVKSIALGECTITITSKRDPSVYAVMPVRVVIPVEKLRTSVETKTLFVGHSTQISCEFLPSDASMQQAVFSSAKRSVADVDENGVITGISRGRTTITVTSLDGQAKSKFNIVVEQKPEEIRFQEEQIKVTVGKKATLKPTVLPSDTNNKKLVWTSSDDEIISVSKNGQVTARKRGEATITATSVADPSVSASVQVSTVQKAESVTLAQKQYDVIIGDTFHLSPSVNPADTSSKAVTYKVKDPRICSVDPNGLVTAIKGGKTTVTVTTADGSNKRTTATIRVVVPVTGVSVEKKRVRVGMGADMYLTANIEPKEATNKSMTWTSSDESIMTVKGNSNKVRIYGHKWGKAKLKGVTEDGEYTCNLIVDVGKLSRAISIKEHYISDGQPYVKFRNRSNMNITEINYSLEGFDVDGEVVRLRTKKNVLNTLYTGIIPPGESTGTIKAPVSNDDALEVLECTKLTITGWKTDTGYYDENGQLLYAYEIESGRPTNTYESEDYIKRQKELEKQEKKD